MKPSTSRRARRKTKKASGLKLALSKAAVGRMLLHIACMARGKNIGWFWNGLRRELKAARKMITPTHNLRRL